MSPCTGAAISWLRLERYALGEAAEAEREQIARHLAACEACRACADRIANDAKVPLPELPVSGRSEPNLAPLVRMRVATVAAALAIAAGAAFAVGRVPHEAHEGSPRGADRTKGDSTSFSLVRNDDALLVDATAAFQEGDRFKAVVTCPPGTRKYFDLVVWDETGPLFPLPPSEAIDCGNDVPLGGAFRVTGTAAVSVCLLFGDEPPRREDAARLREDPARSVCKTLSPAR